MSLSIGASAIISATLQRGDNATPWGFRLRGGTEFNSPIVIERVIGGSLADRCGLRPGDIVRSISGESATQMRHEDAHHAVLRAGNYLKLDLQRQAFDEVRSTGSYDDEDRATTSSTSWSRPGSKANYTPHDVSSSTLVESSYETRSGQNELVSKTSDNNLVAKQGDQVVSYAKPFRPAVASGIGMGRVSDRNHSQQSSNVVNELKMGMDQLALSGAKVVEDGEDHSPIEGVAILPSVWCPPRRHAAQSKSFLKLQSMLDAGEEDPKIPRPSPQWYPPITSSYFQPVVQYEDRTAEIRYKHDDQNSIISNAGNHSISTSTPASRPPLPFTARPEQLAPPPPVPVPRRSPGPRPVPLTSPPPHQPRAFRPGAATRSAAANPASRIPICHRCSRNIRGPFIVALDKTWCPEHFLCDKCGCDMVEIGFVETPDGHIYCEEDYGRYMAPRCHRCRQAIIGTIVKALSAEWHTDCFTCAHCNKSIAGGLFHVEDGKPYCEKDYAQLFQTKCKGCDFAIEPGDRWVEAAGENYHVTCFGCSTCQCSLANRGFVMRNGKPYCTPHSRGL